MTLEYIAGFQAVDMKCYDANQDVQQKPGPLMNTSNGPHGLSPTLQSPYYTLALDNNRYTYFKVWICSSVLVLGDALSNKNFSVIFAIAYSKILK